MELYKFLDKNSKKPIGSQEVLEKLTGQYSELNLELFMDEGELVLVDPLKQSCSAEVVAHALAKFLKTTVSAVSYSTGNVECTYGTRLTDKDLERLWALLGDIPINEEEELDIQFFIWASNDLTRYEIWRWFFSLHSEGIKAFIA